MSAVVLNADQERALDEIVAARRPGQRHLLTGYAGSGKTTLMQHVARQFTRKGLDVVLTAPTHKAVAVLKAKLKQAGLDAVQCRTIHSLLSLKPKPYGDRQQFIRDKRAEPVTADVVVIDECSMVSAELMAHIKRHLPMSFVLFVGDPAQLPPVGEVASQTFDTKGRSHLNTIVRQGAGNPILDAAHAIRTSQGGPMDWSWCKPANVPPLGVFLPRETNAWLQKGFTSPDFDADPDSFRYLAWTNARVADVNRMVRRWRYGDNIPTPFMPGERAMFRGPVVVDGTIQFSTNEEADVATIERAAFQFEVEPCGGVDGWVAEVPSWAVTLRRADGSEKTVHMPSDDRAFNNVIARITDEAADCRGRWKHLHDFKASMAKLQSIYAMTVHTSQGSTFRNAFVDLPDIRRRADSNILETQQMLYVAATRPTHALVLVGA
ncbi:ATP-dependent DNA helicase [Roseomonas xinghualingensis]|uniref:ATP-dependent DNA helicase n=1 Tax=Roseomonas xinghualingensis TaxID=2986475 RepID=UPI0021F1AEE8|nr:AAA family ATPase [Roseomonas sp. SXEYE001]MCV4209968.1 AAA family ATPase [Roseomonas sp. SXEYE001]